jgi:hypothetical protein
METIEARIHIVISEDAAKNDKDIQQQMRSLSNEIYKVCGVPPHVLVEVGSKPTQFTPAQVATQDVINEIKQQIDAEEEKYKAAKEMTELEKADAKWSRQRGIVDAGKSIKDSLKRGIDKL